MVAYANAITEIQFDMEIFGHGNHNLPDIERVN